MTSEEAIKKYGDKVSPPFTELRDGLPCDRVWYRGKRYLAPLSFAPEPERISLRDRQIRCWMSDQSGFFIETPSASLLFDWYRSALPPIRRDKPLHVFISHIHWDHFHSGLLSLAKRFPEVSIYLGYDYSEDWLNKTLEKLPEPCGDSVSCFRGGQLLKVEGGSVRSLESTDLGVAFLVRMDGLCFYHGGDLFPWQGAEEAFLDSIAELGGERIDYAMLPLDPRFPEAARLCVTACFAQTEIRCFSPMHLWGKPEFAGSFAEKNPQFRDRMVSPNPGKLKILRTVERMKPYTLEL